MVNKPLLGAVAAAGLAVSLASAKAADIIEAMPAGPDWTGPYIGLNAGYAFSSNEVSVENVGVSNTPQSLIDFLGTDTLDLDSDGFIGGVQVGYNWQTDAIILGIEADAQYTDVSGSDIISTTLGPTPEFSGSQDLDFLVTLRARLGLAVSEGILIYATGGLAVGDVDLDGRITVVPGTDEWVGGGSETQWGWTAGAGAEIMVTDTISVKAEYLYVDLGDESFTAPGTFSPDFEIVEFDFENQFHILRAGLNWHF